MSRMWSLVVCLTTLQCLADSRGAEIPTPLEGLRGVPISIEVDGVVVQLEAHVWRDFMPGLLSDTATHSQGSAVPGRPMIAVQPLIGDRALHGEIS